LSLKGRLLGLPSSGLDGTSGPEHPEDHEADRNANAIDAEPVQKAGPIAPWLALNKIVRIGGKRIHTRSYGLPAKRRAAVPSQETAAQQARREEIRSIAPAACESD